MAQHIPITAFKQLVFKKINYHIRRDFQFRPPLTSMKYRWEGLEGSSDNPDIKVFITERHIGKGFVWGSDRGCFEIHYNTYTRRIDNIYFVA